MNCTTPSIAVVVLGLLLCSGHPSLAEEIGSSPENEVPTLHGSLKLSLADAVAMGIENNLDLQVERFDPILSFEDHEISWGAFDPTASGDFGYESSYTPNASRIAGAEPRSRNRQTDGGVGVQGLIPYLGATVGLEYRADKIDTTFGKGFFQTINPEWNSSLALTGSLPLLKGLIWNEPWTRVKTSAVRLRGSKQGFRTDLMDVVQTIENNYWNLIANKDAVKVAEKSLDTARSLLGQTEVQYEVGVKSRVEVVEAEAGVASREVDLIRAVNRYRRSQDELIDVVLGTRLTADSRLEFEPTDDPSDYLHYEINLHEASEKAFANRPELAIAAYEIERQELQLRFAKNQRLPQLDIQGRFGVSGKVGKDVSGAVPPDDTGDGLGDATGDWFSHAGGRDFSVRGVVSIPIGNVAARHSVSRTRLELRRAKTQLIRLRQNIILEVRDRARNLESAQEGIEAAERRRLAAAEQLRAERVRLEYGESTPFNVLQKEEDLVEAENEKILAVRLYRTSLVDLNRAQGTILKARNIVVEEAAVLR
jgi:outer membrane protein TolC